MMHLDSSGISIVFYICITLFHWQYILMLIWLYCLTDGPLEGGCHTINSSSHWIVSMCIQCLTFLFFSYLSYEISNIKNSKEDLFCMAGEGREVPCSMDIGLQNNAFQSIFPGKFRRYTPFISYFCLIYSRLNRWKPIKKETFF